MEPTICEMCCKPAVELKGDLRKGRDVPAEEENVPWLRIPTVQFIADQSTRAQGVLLNETKERVKSRILPLGLKGVSCAEAVSEI